MPSNNRPAARGYSSLDRAPSRLLEATHPLHVRGGGTCYGDSGGPVFYKDTQTVIAVTSFGWAKNGNCIGNSFFYRTDIAVSQDFLEEVLEMYGD